jgi:hypothetical protein
MEIAGAMNALSKDPLAGQVINLGVVLMRALMAKTGKP